MAQTLYITLDSHDNFELWYEEPVFDFNGGYWVAAERCPGADSGTNIDKYIAAMFGCVLDKFVYSAKWAINAESKFVEEIEEPDRVWDEEEDEELIEA